jgi:hypothetical protein
MLLPLVTVFVGIFLVWVVPGHAGTLEKVDLGLQQYLGEFGLSYRILQGPQGWFDMLAGFRFTYLGDQMGLQADQANIKTASTDLVDLFAQQVTTPGSNLNTLIQQTIQSRLGSLAGRNPGLPVPPLAGREPGTIFDLIRGLIQSRRPELAAAIQAGVQARVNQLKVELANDIASSLTGRLSQSFSLYEDWFDPFIGVRGRYNFYKPFYLTAEGDVSGFGIGSEVTSGLCRNRVPNHSEHLFRGWLSVSLCGLRYHQPHLSDRDARRADHRRTQILEIEPTLVE